MFECYYVGGVVGYVIIGMLILGLLIGLYKLIILILVGGKICLQFKNLGLFLEFNFLGCILKVYVENKGIDVENIELKLDEVILKELLCIEVGINIIKIFFVIVLLLGLLGIVFGMIVIF